MLLPVKYVIADFVLQNSSLSLGAELGGMGRRYELRLPTRVNWPFWSAPVHIARGKPRTSPRGFPAFGRQRFVVAET